LDVILNENHVWTRFSDKEIPLEFDRHLNPVSDKNVYSKVRLG
jgi:hypothetical protein